MRLRIWLTVLASFAPSFIAISVPGVLAQETGVCDAKWDDAIGEECRSRILGRLRKMAAGFTTVNDCAL
ncbi:MAG: hypothetical protein NTNFB02_29830 [Nitrospira sp.]